MDETHQPKWKEKEHVTRPFPRHIIIMYRILSRNKSPSAAVARMMLRLCPNFSISVFSNSSFAAQLTVLFCPVCLQLFSGISTTFSFLIVATCHCHRFASLQRHHGTTVFVSRKVIQSSTYSPLFALLSAPFSYASTSGDCDRLTLLLDRGLNE